MVLQESLHCIIAEEVLHVPEQLEAFLVRNIRERVIWVVAFQDRVDAGVAIVESVTEHVLIK